MKIVNLHRLHSPNIGDINSSPCLYFPELANVVQEDICDYQMPSLEELGTNPFHVAEGGVIIGGGGLLACDFFSPSLDAFFANRRPNTKVVIWGAGHNKHEAIDWSVLRPDLGLSKFQIDLAGVRDSGYPYQWVPCASCMSPLFDKSYDVKHEVVVYIHANFERSYLKKVEESRFPPSAPRMRNEAVEFADAVAFLGSAETVLTDSFHGAYWATMLGKRVVAFANSSKFFGLRHPVPICDPVDWRRYAGLSLRYPESLGESREANVAFAAKAFDLLGL